MTSRRDAGLLVGWVLALYVGAAWARPAAEALRARGLLASSVWILSAGVFLGILALLRDRPGRRPPTPSLGRPSDDRPGGWPPSPPLGRPSDDRPGGRPPAGSLRGLSHGPSRPPLPIPPLALLATGLAAAWLATWWNLPEERIHLAQYGPVGVLAWRAIGGRLAPALVLGASLGLGDELVQGLLPSRTFDWWDVVANGIAAAAGVFVARGGRGAWTAPAILLGARLLLPVLHPGHPGVSPASGDPGRDGVSPPPVHPSEPRPAFATGAAPDAAAPPAQVAQPAPYRGASVLLVTIDALRADRVPPWGHAAVPTPALDRLASEALALDGRANALWTTPSMVSLFTGLDPATHGVAGRGLELAPSITTPLETLQRAGWRVSGHAGDDTETYRNLGFEREIDPDRPPETVAAEELMAGPAFLWLHLRSIHAPYDTPVERLDALGLPRPPPSPVLDRARSHYTVPRAQFPGDHAWLKPALSALYDAEVADADAALGRILGALDAAGVEPIVVLTADHGEELLERNGIGHASTTLASQPWPELVDVPLLIRFPDGRRAGERALGGVQQVDVLRSLLPLLGLRPEPAAPGVPLDGRDLSAFWLAGRAPPAVPVLVHSSPCGWQCPPERRAERVSALFDGRWLRCTDTCPPALQERLDAAEVRRSRLATPVASP